MEGVHEQAQPLSHGPSPPWFARHRVTGFSGFRVQGVQALVRL